MWSAPTRSLLEQAQVPIIMSMMSMMIHMIARTKTMMRLISFVGNAFSDQERYVWTLSYQMTPPPYLPILDVPMQIPAHKLELLSQEVRNAEKKSKSRSCFSMRFKTKYLQHISWLNHNDDTFQGA